MSCGRSRCWGRRGMIVRYLWLLVIILVAACAALGFYVWPERAELLSPRGELTVGVLSGLVLMVLQILVVSILFEYLTSRRRVKVAQLACDLIATDTKVLIGFYANMAGEFVGASSRKPIKSSIADNLTRHVKARMGRLRSSVGRGDNIWHGVSEQTAGYFQQELQSKAIASQISFLASQMEPEQLVDVGRFVGLREEMQRQFELAIGLRPERLMEVLFSPEGSLVLTSDDDSVAIHAAWFLRAFTDLTEWFDDAGAGNLGDQAAIEQSARAFDRLLAHLDGPTPQSEPSAV
jgi:hypothetical protein